MRTFLAALSRNARDHDRPDDGCTDFTVLCTRGMNKRVDPPRQRGTSPSPSNPAGEQLGSVRRPGASAVRTAF